MIIHVCVLPAFMSMHYANAEPETGQKQVSDLLKLELQMVVSCHVSAGNQTLVLENSQNCYRVQAGGVQPSFVLSPQ